MLILANLVPVLGVWLWGWSATEIFIVYAMETLILGCITVLKMLVTIVAGGKPASNESKNVSAKGGLFIIFFFIFHFGMFAMVQTGIFSQVADIIPPGKGFTYFFFHWYEYINRDIAYMLIAFTLGHLGQTFFPFILKKEYREVTVIHLMVEPYGRIFIQQFTVILGAMFLQLGWGKVFILIFAIVKILFEVFADFKSLMQKNMQGKTSGIS